MKLSVLVEETSPDLSRLITPDVAKLGDMFSRYNEEIRIVGGAVRDALLGKKPKDIDLATTATPEKMLTIAKEENIRVIETGLQHGTVTFVLNEEPYEITTLRVDKETDGRHATVDWTTSFKEDARRRDLTYNAMSVDMDGKLHDYFGGLKDLRKGSTKFVGNTEERIQEDFLRILRYFRFLAKHPNQSPDKDILEKIKNNAKGLHKVSGERIWMELSKMATYPNFENSLQGMCSSGIGEIIHINCSRQNIREVSRIQDETNNPITILSPLFNESSFLRFANHLKIPNDSKRLGLFIQSQMRNPKDAYTYDILTNQTSVYHVKELAKVINNKEISEQIKRLENAGPFPVTGNDLIQKGTQPGPALGRTLNMLKKEWINSNFSLTKDQLLAKMVNSKKEK